MATSHISVCPCRNPAFAGEYGRALVHWAGIGEIDGRSPFCDFLSLCRGSGRITADAHIARAESGRSFGLHLRIGDRFFCSFSANAHYGAHFFRHPSSDGSKMAWIQHRHRFAFSPCYRAVRKYRQCSALGWGACRLCVGAVLHTAIPCDELRLSATS